MQILPNAKSQFIDSAGQPLASGTVGFYFPGTLNPKPTFQDAAGTIANTNPVALDSRGQALIWGSGVYRQIVKDASGVTIWDQITEDPNAGLTGNMTDDVFVAGDGTGKTFIPGTTTQLNLDVAPSSITNTWIFFDGVYQGDSNIASLTGTTLTFSSPIPMGIQTVTVKIGSTIAIGSIGSGTVTSDSIASSGIDSGKLTYLATGAGAVRRTGQSKWSDVVSVLDYGAKGDGVTDDSAAIQAAIDANKGCTIIFPGGKTFYCAGIALNGSTYNNTALTGDGWLLMKPDGGLSNFGGGWVGVLLEQCDGVSLNLRIDGNRSNMTAREQIFCVGLAGATNTRIPHLKVREIRGDGLYVGQANWTANSSNTIGIEAGLIEGSNIADDGRNLVSIISGQAIHIDRLVSSQIGGIINGFTEPGGLDIEPDFGYQTCYDITVDSVDVTTAGTSGIGVFGKSASGNDANLDWNCSQIVIGNARILRTGTSGSGLAGSGFTRCADLKIIEGFYQFNTTRGAGPVHDFSQRVEANWTVTNVTYGAWLAPSGTIYDFDFKIMASGYSQCAVQVTSLQAGRIRGRGFSSVAGTTYGVHANNNARSVTQQNVSYEMDLPYDNVMSNAFYNDPSNPVTFGAGCIARNCDWSGYASYAATCNAIIPLQDVIGMTWAASIPTNGNWHWQTFVRNSQPAVAAGKATIGWARLNSGSNNVNGNDWTPCVCTNA